MQKTQKNIDFITGLAFVNILNNKNIKSYHKKAINEIFEKEFFENSNIVTESKQINEFLAYKKNFDESAKFNFLKREINKNLFYSTNNNTLYDFIFEAEEKKEGWWGKLKRGASNLIDKVAGGKNYEYMDDEEKKGGFDAHTTEKKGEEEKKQGFFSKAWDVTKRSFSHVGRFVNTLSPSIYKSKSEVEKLRADVSRMAARLKLENLDVFDVLDDLDNKIETAVYKDEKRGTLKTPAFPNSKEILNKDLPDHHAFLRGCMVLSQSYDTIVQLHKDKKIPTELANMMITVLQGYVHYYDKKLTSVYRKFESFLPVNKKILFEEAEENTENSTKAELLSPEDTKKIQSQMTVTQKEIEDIKRKNPELKNYEAELESVQENKRYISVILWSILGAAVGGLIGPLIKNMITPEFLAQKITIPPDTFKETSQIDSVKFHKFGGTKIDLSWLMPMSGNQPEVGASHYFLNYFKANGITAFDTAEKVQKMTAGQLLQEIKANNINVADLAKASPNEADFNKFWSQTVGDKANSSKKIGDLWPFKTATTIQANQDLHNALRIDPDNINKVANKLVLSLPTVIIGMVGRTVTKETVKHIGTYVGASAAATGLGFSIPIALPILAVGLLTSLLRRKGLSSSRSKVLQLLKDRMVAVKEGDVEPPPPPVVEDPPEPEIPDIKQLPGGEPTPQLPDSVDQPENTEIQAVKKDISNELQVINTNISDGPAVSDDNFYAMFIYNMNERPKNNIARSLNLESILQNEKLLKEFSLIINDDLKLLKENVKIQTSKDNVIRNLNGDKQQQIVQGIFTASGQNKNYNILLNNQIIANVIDEKLVFNNNNYYDTNTFLIALKKELEKKSNIKPETPSTTEVTPEVPKKEVAAAIEEISEKAPEVSETVSDAVENPTPQNVTTASQEVALAIRKTNDLDLLTQLKFVTGQLAVLQQKISSLENTPKGRGVLAKVRGEKNIKVMLVPFKTSNLGTVKNIVKWGSFLNKLKSIQDIQTAIAYDPTKIKKKLIKKVYIVNDFTTGDSSNIDLISHFIISSINKNQLKKIKDQSKYFKYSDIKLDKLNRNKQFIKFGLEKIAKNPKGLFKFNNSIIPRLFDDGVLEEILKNLDVSEKITKELGSSGTSTTKQLGSSGTSTTSGGTASNNSEKKPEGNKEDKSKDSNSEAAKSESEKSKVKEFEAELEKIKPDNNTLSLNGNDRSEIKNNDIIKKIVDISKKYINEFKEDDLYAALSNNTPKMRARKLVKVVGHPDKNWSNEQEALNHFLRSLKVKFNNNAEPEALVESLKLRNIIRDFVRKELINTRNR